MNPTPKDLLNKNRELREKVVAVTTSEWFAQYLCMVRAELLMSGLITPDMQHGMQRYENMLLEITNVTPEGAPSIVPRLSHNIDDGLRQRTIKEDKSPKP